MGCHTAGLEAREEIADACSKVKFKAAALLVQLHRDGQLWVRGSVQLWAAKQSREEINHQLNKSLCSTHS